MSTNNKRDVSNMIHTGCYPHKQSQFKTERAAVTWACSASRRERSIAAAALACSISEISSFSLRSMRSSSASIWSPIACRWATEKHAENEGLGT
jgi:hypothetical protein